MLPTKKYYFRKACFLRNWKPILIDTFATMFQQTEQVQIFNNNKIVQRGTHTTCTPPCTIHILPFVVLHPLNPLNLLHEKKVETSVLLCAVIQDQNRSRVFRNPEIYQWTTSLLPVSWGQLYGQERSTKFPVCVPVHWIQGKPDKVWLQINR
jgi:hypothetical protein